MSKAYDRVEWVFLDEVMRKMHFPEIWINRVMRCVSSVSYSILLNGVPGDFFRPERGLRQGDPLSPYLFVLFAEGLSSIIHKAESQSQITGLRVTRAAPSISYLFFADDSLIFTKATIEECNAMLQILQTYEKASGQVINFEKSAILFSPNVRRELKQSLLETCYIVTVAFIEKYLGFPTRTSQK